MECKPKGGEYQLRDIGIWELSSYLPVKQSMKNWMRNFIGRFSRSVLPYLRFCIQDSLVLAIVPFRIDTEFETGIRTTIIRAKSLRLSIPTQHQYPLKNWVPQFAPSVPNTVFQEYS